MLDKIKQLGRDSAVYGIGGILGNAVSFLLLPLYTRVFTPAEYGYIEFVNVFSFLLAALLTMGLDSAQSFFFFERKSEGITGQRAVISGILQWRLFSGLVLVTIGCLAAPYLAVRFFDAAIPPNTLVVAFVGAFFLQVMWQAAEVFRLLFQPWSYIQVVLTSTIVTSVASIIFVVGLRLGPLGFFLGTLVGGVVAATFAWVRLRSFLDVRRSHAGEWPQLLKFGLPLLPVSLIAWLMSTSDRWLLVELSTAATLGLYALGARFALLINVGTEMFRKAWWPMAMDAMQDGEAGKALFRAIARGYFGVGMMGVVALTAFSPLLVRMFAGPEFRAAYPVVGILALSSILYGFQLIGGAGVWKAKKTWWATIGTAVGAAVSISLSIILIPRFGAIGAAIGTATGMFAINVVSVRAGERLWNVGLPVGLLLAQLACASAAVGLLLWFFAHGTNIIAPAATTLVALLVLSRSALPPSYRNPLTWFSRGAPHVAGGEAQ